MMEGIRRGGLAGGHLKLSNLCWIYDNNHITIEGNTALAYSDDTATRFMGYGQRHAGGRRQRPEMSSVFNTSRPTTDRPTLIIVDSHIAYGAPHSRILAPLTESRWARKRSLAKRNYGWPEDAVPGP
jgi:transketolase